MQRPNIEHTYKFSSQRYTFRNDKKHNLNFVLVTTHSSLTPKTLFCHRATFLLFSPSNICSNICGSFHPKPNPLDYCNVLMCEMYFKPRHECFFTFTVSLCQQKEKELLLCFSPHSDYSDSNQIETLKSKE